MTVSNEVYRNQYTANGSNTAFAYGFKINANTELTVIVTDTSGASTTQTLTTDYTVGGVGNDGGGNVTFVTAPTNAYLVTIVPSAPITQNVNYVANDAFPEVATEDALDKLTMIGGKQQEELDRCIKVRKSTDDSLGFDGEIDLTSGASKYLRVKSDRSGIELVDGTDGGTSGLASIDGVSNAGGNVDLIAGSNITITPDDSANTITIAAASAGINSLNSVTNAGGNVDLIAGTAITVTADDGNDQITIALNPTGISDNTISGDKIDGGTISDFASQGIDDNATTEVLELSNNNTTIKNDLRIESTDPKNTMTDTDGPTDEKNIRISNNGGQFQIRMLNDDKTTSVNFFELERTAVNADLITLTADTIKGAGAMSITGALSAGSLNFGVDDLDDTTISGAATGEVLTYNGTGWVNQTAGALSAALNDLTDVTITTPADGAVLLYSTTTGSWYDDTIAGGVSNINDLGDVTIAGASTGQVLKYNGTGWVNDTVAAGVGAIDDLSDVSITGAATADQLIYTSDSQWENLSNNVFNVLAFGAVGDNSTDDATAINNAITAAQAVTGGGVVYFPAGKYRIASTITKTLTAPIRIKGDGADTTTLRWSAGTHGFDFAGGTISVSSIANNFVAVEGLTLETSQAGAGSALQVSWTDGAGNIDRTLTMRNVIMQGETHNTHYWLKGLDCTNGRNAYINDAHFFGKRGSTLGTGFYFTGDAGGSPVDNVMNSCSVYWADRAVDVDGVFEGLYVEQCRFIVCNYGIDWNTTGDEPLLSVQGCHINCYKFDIYGYNVIQTVIHGNLLYQPTASDDNWVGIELDGTNATGTDADVSIKDNIIEWFSGSGSKNGIVIDARGKGYIGQNTIKDMDTGVWLQSNSQNIKVIDNDFNTCTTDILDSGSNNITRLITSTSDFRGAMVYRTSAQSISTASWTKVSWNATNYDTSSIVSGNTLVVPSGVTRVRLKCNILFNGVSASLDTAARVSITKNGQSFASNSYIGQPHCSIGLNQAGPSANLESPVLTVIAGDYFEVEVRQDSGSSLDIAPTNTKNANVCWFSMEIV
jgi:hypothetical protein